MTQTTVPTSGGPAPLPLPRRILGVLFSPTPTFEAIVAHPTWLAVMALTTVVAAALWFGFLSTEVGRQAFTDSQIESQERWGATITPEVEQRVAAQTPMMRWIVPISTFVIGPLFAVAIAGIVYAIFGAIMGGGGTFRQVLAVVAHAGVVPTVASIGVMALNYARETMASATNLAVFVPMLPEESFIVRFLGTIDLIWVWYVVIMAIGLGVLYRRKTSSIAIGFLGLYLVIALIIAGARSAMGGS